MLWRRCLRLPAKQLLSCGSDPLRRFISIGQPHSPRREPTLRVTVPSQRFSRPQGFHPPNTCGHINSRSRPWGFPFRVFFIRRASRFFKRSCPLEIGCHATKGLSRIVFSGILGSPALRFGLGQGYVLRDALSPGP